MRLAWITFLNDMRRSARDPFSILLWAGIPFGVLILFTLAFGSGGDVKPQARVLLVDEDSSLLSGFLSGAFNQGELAELVDLQPVTREEGERRIAKGDGTALLIIPAGFSEAVLNDDPTTLRLITNPAQRILPGIVEGILKTLVDGTFYLQQVLGGPVREIMESTNDLADPPTNLLVSSVSVEINETIQRLEEYILPPAIELVVEMEEKDEEAPAFGFGGIYFQSMLFMFLLFGAQGISDGLWREREERTLSRIVSTPGRLSAFLLGKVLAGVTVLGGILAAALAAGTWLYDLPWATYPAALLWLVLVAGLLIALFSLVQLVATSRGGASLINNVIVFPMMMLGGSFFPPEGMPDWLAAIGRYTPNGYGLHILKMLQAGAPDAGTVLSAFAGFAAVTGIALWMASARLRSSFAKAAS
ncbi:MAG: ABC transporter permease [Acidobacteria bacterium]|uniref:ABC transporter permease n=1 Tax=Candidatus Polarisedimenticola svalbardensis TaxID=2886004 RepID=A0A8J6YAD1_9BACT|nr:ABC transporter permease [Candidatus Polarisedimenticola svalbardensis]